MTDEAIVILSTVPDHATGEKIAHALLEARAAACVHIALAGTSIYRWEGKIETATEHKLFIKTTRARFADVERIVKTEHPYQVPEIVALTVTAGSESYLRWLASETA